jgi:hypothetical protein
MCIRFKYGQHDQFNAMLATITESNNVHALSLAQMDGRKLKVTYHGRLKHGFRTLKSFTS